MVAIIRRNFKIIIIGVFFIAFDILLSFWFILDWKPILLQKLFKLGEFESKYQPLNSDPRKMTWLIGGYIKNIGVGYIKISYGKSKEKVAKFSKDTLFFEGQIREVNPKQLKRVYQVPGFSIGDYVKITFIMEDSTEITRAILLEK